MKRKTWSMHTGAGSEHGKHGQTCALQVFACKNNTKGDHICENIIWIRPCISVTQVPAQTHTHTRKNIHVSAESRFTHIIQFRHDGAAAPHFKLKQVDDLLRVSQWFQDVHDASCVLLLLCQTETWRYAPHPNDATPGCSCGRGGSDSEEKSAPSHLRRQIDWRFRLVRLSWS